MLLVVLALEEDEAAIILAQLEPPLLPPFEFGLFMILFRKIVSTGTGGTKQCTPARRSWEHKRGQMIKGVDTNRWHERYAARINIYQSPSWGKLWATRDEPDERASTRDEIRSRPMPDAGWTAIESSNRIIGLI